MTAYNVFNKKLEMNRVAGIALIVVMILSAGAATAIFAEGSFFNVRLFSGSLTGGLAQGSGFVARTYLGPISGTSNAQGTSYVANIGFFGNAILSTSPPIIVSSEIYPRLIGNSSSLRFFIYSRYARNLTANVTLPNGTAIRVNLTNRQNTTFFETPLVGMYNVMFIAENNYGSVTSNESFEAKESQRFTINVSNEEYNGIFASFRVINSGFIYGETSSVGNVSLLLPDLIYDMEVSAYSNINITFRGINITNNNLRGLILGNETSAGYLATYYVGNQFNITNATIRMYYSNLLVTYEDGLELYVCHDYNTSLNSCNTEWENITSAATRNDLMNYFEYTTEEFSAFSIKQQDVPESGQILIIEDRPIGFGMPRKYLDLQKEILCGEEKVKLTLKDNTSGNEVYPATIWITGNGIDLKKKMSDAQQEIIVSLSDGEYVAKVQANNYYEKVFTFSIDCKELTQEPIDENIELPQNSDEDGTSVNETSQVTGWTVDKTTTDIVTSPQNQQPSEFSENNPELKGKFEWSAVIKYSTVGLIVIILLSFALLKSKTTKQPKGKIESSTSSNAQVNNQIKEHKLTVDSSVELVPPPAVMLPLSAQETILNQAATLPEQMNPIANNISLQIPTLNILTIKEISEKKLEFSVLLRDVTGDEAFVFSNGEKIRSMAGLATKLANMEDSVFSYHVTNCKNDFAAWVYHVLGDEKLALEIGQIKNKKDMNASVERRIIELLRK